MFGFSFGELVILVIVAVVVIGPKELPKVLRTAGQWAGKLRRMAADMRRQSGIDDVLRTEGLHQDIAEIRKLARGEIDDVARAARVDAALPHEPVKELSKPLGATTFEPPTTEREREHPTIGPDAYSALPDTAIVYAETLPQSPLAKDALYTQGEAEA